MMLTMIGRRSATSVTAQPAEDMRDLAQVMAHMHGQEIEELDVPPLDS
jgi:hypothetical protein